MCRARHRVPKTQDTSKLKISKQLTQTSIVRFFKTHFFSLFQKLTGQGPLLPTPLQPTLVVSRKEVMNFASKKLCDFELKKREKGYNKN